MNFIDEWVEKTVSSKSLEEFRRVLSEDVRTLCIEVAKARAVLIALESLHPHIRPKTDRALQRLRNYGLVGDWQWRSERAMARDLAELVEDIEASKQLGNAAALQYRVVLLRLFTDKLDMDRGMALLDGLEHSDADTTNELLEELRQAALNGWQEGISQLATEMKALQGDPLAAFKAYANAELGIKRFVRPASSTFN